jgi:drug/metabolite transporter (DMT)-like permease
MISIRLLLLFCVVIWGWTFVATKICLSYLHPIELVGYRFLIGLPLLYLIVRSRKISVAFSKSEWKQLAVGALIIAVHFLLQAIAIQYTSATNAGWLIAVIPLAIAGLSYLILKERITLRQVVGIIVATAGIFFLISKGDFANIAWMSSVGDWLILASAHTWALYTIATKKVSQVNDPLAVTLIVFLPVMLIGVGYALTVSSANALGSMPTEGWVALLFLGVLGTLAQWFWQIGVAKIGAARAGIFLYLEPVATTALAVPLLQESFTMFTAVGGLLVLAGVWWAEKS